ncbi:hypothetical protein JCM10207_009014 [Rhodosporidiobolus poonsookiae]
MAAVSSSPTATIFETLTVTSLIPTVTGSTTFVVVDPNAISVSTLTETLRGQTVTRVFTATGATVTTVEPLTGTATSLVVTSSPIETLYTTISSSSSSTTTTTTTTSSTSSTTTTTSSSTSSSTTPTSTRMSTVVVTESASSSAPSSSATLAGSGSGSGSGGGTNIGAIVGGAVGGGVGLILLLLALWYFAKKRREKREREDVDYFAQHGEDAWDPAAVGGAATGGVAAGAAGRRISRRHPSGGRGDAYDGEKYFETGFAVLPQNGRLKPAQEQDAYYANFSPPQQPEFEQNEMSNAPSSYSGYTGAGTAAGAGAGAALLGRGPSDGSRSAHSHHNSAGGHQQHYGAGPSLPPGASPYPHPQPSPLGDNFAGVGANGRANGAGMSMPSAYPAVLASTSFDPRGRDGGYAVASSNRPPSQGYPPQSSTPASLPASIAYNPPHSSFMGPTDLQPPSSNRFGAYSSSGSGAGHPAPQQSHPGASASPVPSYRSIPQLGAIPRADSETGTDYGSSAAGAGQRTGGQGRSLRVVNEGEGERDPYGGLDEGLDGLRR